MAFEKAVILITDIQQNLVIDGNKEMLERMAETLLEADQRNMWNAGDEMKQELQELYLSVEGELEDDGDDDE